MTLIEVMAGLAIMGTVLGALLVAAARLRIQSARAELRLEACGTADRLLDRWWPQKDRLPREDTGTVRAAGKTWRWRTHPVANGAAEQMGAQVVAVEVYPADRQGEGPMAHVEVLLPKESHAKADRPDAD